MEATVRDASNMAKLNDGHVGVAVGMGADDDPRIAVVMVGLEFVEVPDQLLTFLALPEMAEELGRALIAAAKMARVMRPS